MGGTRWVHIARKCQTHCLPAGHLCSCCSTSLENPSGPCTQFLRLSSSDSAPPTQLCRETHSNILLLCPERLPSPAAYILLPLRPTSPPCTRSTFLCAPTLLCFTPRMHPHSPVWEQTWGHVALPNGEDQAILICVSFITLPLPSSER